MSDSIFSDDFKAQPFWWDATPRPELDQAELPDKTEVLIIGSGYTGLNCALETTRGGMNTLVIDAQTAGWCPSVVTCSRPNRSIRPE